MKRREYVRLFSIDHPELRDGEVWITNTSVKRASDFLRKFGTARFGDIAYGTTGNAVPDLVPVFVSRRESLFWLQRLREPDEYKPVPYDDDPFAHGGYMRLPRVRLCGGV